MTTLQKTSIAGLVAVAISAGLVQHRTSESLRTENATLRQQTNQLAELEELRLGNQRLAKLRIDADELERLRKDQTELLRLRGEVGLLRRQVADAARLEEQRRQEAAKIAAGVAKPQVEVRAGSIRFIEYDAQKVLPSYEAISGLELDVSPTLPGLGSKITFESERDMTRSEAVALFEKALQEQAGLVIRHSAPGRATVLYDKSVMKRQVQ